MGARAFVKPDNASRRQLTWIACRLGNAQPARVPSPQWHAGTTPGAARRTRRAGRQQLLLRRGRRSRCGRPPVPPTATRRRRWSDRSRPTLEPARRPPGPHSPRSRWVAARGRAASTSPSRPTSSCSASSKRPCRTRSSARRTERTGTKRAVAEPPDAHGIAERSVCFAPPAGRGQQAAVVRATERGHGRQVSAARDVLTDPDPLIGAVDVMCVLACREELAEDLLDHREVVDVASRHCRQRFVEEQHALVDSVVMHEARAEIRKR